MADLFAQAHYQQIIDQLSIHKLHATSSYVYIGYHPKTGGELSRAYMKVPALEFDKPFESQTRTCVGYNYFDFHEIKLKTRAVAHAWNKLPSLNAMIDCYEESYAYETAWSSSGPFCHLQHAIKSFTRAYCNTPGPLPLVS